MSSDGWPKCTTIALAEKELLMWEQKMCPLNTPFQLHLADLQSSGQAQCTTVWNKGTVAYRCRTCQVNDSSAICMGCFLKGDHKKHDWIMYHSESGGCCDCGDPEAWEVSGFCTAHRSLERQDPCVPAPLVDATKASVGWVLVQLSLIVSDIEEPKNGPPVSQDNKIAMANFYLNWLQQVCAVDALRKIMCIVMIEERVKPRGTSKMETPLHILLKTLAGMPEEIMEGETTLYLQMLYDSVFKQQFSEELVGHYKTMIEKVVGNVKDFKALDSSLDRVMVQLFNVPNMELIREKDILKLFVKVFGDVLRRCVNRGTVDIHNARIQNKVYLRPQGDLRLVVAHTCVAIYVLEERHDIFNSMLDVLTLLQWMNPYSLRSSVNFDEENTWTLAIQLEMNTMAIMFQLIGRCFANHELDSKKFTMIPKKTLISAANLTLAKLRTYLSKELILDGLKSSAQTSVSLHIPLHRTLSAILAKLVLLPWEDENEGFLSSLQFNYSEEEVLALMEHPLRITVWMAQIRANQWKEAEDFSRLELIYRGSFWHDQSMDMDILMLQFCTVARKNMEHAVILRMAERFELEDLVSSPCIHPEEIGRAKISLLQDFMRLILLVVRERRNTGMKEDNCLQYDVIQWLCVRDQTYSQLCRALSAIPVDNHKLNEMLEKVAHFHNAKVQERGYYQLKAEYWQNFDPLFAHFYSNELEDAQERAVHVGKLQHYWRIKPPVGAKPPYNRLINLLHTQRCHLLLWNVLNYVSFLVTSESTATAGEALGVIALQMMGIALQDQRENAEKCSISADTWQELLLPCNDLFQNVCRRPHCNQETGAHEWGLQDSEYPSILDLLGKLQSVKNAPRLVDSIDYILYLLNAPPLTSSEEKEVESVVSPKSHVRLFSAEDDERRLKKQRQEEIMAQFKAKQNAFMERFDISDDEDGDYLDDSTEYSEAGCGSMSSSTFSPSGARSNNIPMEPLELHECAFCRTECGGNDKPTGWIALVQRYNMPSVLLNRGDDVSSVGDADSITKKTNVRDVKGYSSDPDQFQLVIDMGNEKTVDHVPTEHVRCCGHQMHQECFQSYHASLVKSHCCETTYEGKNIIDLDHTEFLCPICRRLANVLLPVVHQASLSRMLQSYDDNRLPVQRDRLMKLWDTRKNLPEAIESFSIQSLRVRSNFRNEAMDLPKCPVLWEVLAGNVIHCEVETREELSELASSSTTPAKLIDELTWGGDSGHWIAIRELGKLAMLSNTLKTAQEMEAKRTKIGKMITIISDMLRNEIFAQIQPFRSNLSSVHVALGKVQDKLKSIYEAQLQMDVVPTKVEPVQELGKTKLVDMFVSDANRDRDVGREKDQRLLPAEPPPMMEYNRARFVVDFDGVMPGGETDNKEEGTVTELERMQQRSTSVDERNQYESKGAPYKMEWSSSILSGSLLEADPFWLLIVLLSVFPAMPSLDEVLFLVKFAYSVAVAQILLACSSLQNDDHDNVLDSERDWGVVIQQTSLPFLRRAALLVHIITIQDFKGEHFGPGRKVMDATYLQQELGLTDCDRSFTDGKGAGEASLTTTSILQQLSHDHAVAGGQLKLKKVPTQLRLADLPLVFQELLLRSIQEKCSECDSIPRDPAVCLVCGVFFCCNSECCTKDKMGECSRHAETKYAGIGIFLLMRSTQTMLIRGNRTCMAPSLYLDQHGEDACGDGQDELDAPYGREDAYLRRSQLLHLSDLRLNEVRRLWLSAGFDYDTQILHSSQTPSRSL